jgi:hypothetical protein
MLAQGGDVSSLLPGEHGRGLAFQVEVGLAADVDHDPVDWAKITPSAPGEGMSTRAPML